MAEPGLASAVLRVLRRAAAARFAEPLEGQLGPVSPAVLAAVSADWTVSPADELRLFAQG
jgi:hypothetical protein